MSGNFSKLARQGSHTSASSSGSIDRSSHNHLFRSLHSLHTYHPTSWRDEIWTHLNLRNERIATGTVPRGTAIMTREMMEIHIQRAPDVRSMMDCLPVASLEGTAFVGWRQKVASWPKK